VTGRDAPPRPVARTGAREPSTPEGAREPVAPEGAREPVAPEGAREPVAPAGAREPVAPAGAREPSTPEGAPGPATPEGAREPATPAGALAPASRAGARNPVPPDKGPDPGAAAGVPAPAPRPATTPLRPRRPLRRRLGRAALIGLPLALLAGLLAFAHGAFHAPAPQPGETDGIVVLTGGSARVATGFRLLGAGEARLLLISGAHPEASLPGIAAAAGVDPAPFAGRVTIGHAAASTRGNAVEAAAWARAHGMRSLRIVTAGYHMPRAMLEMRRAVPGLRLVPHPVPSAALRAPGAAWRAQPWALLAGEYARYLGAWAGLSGAFVPRRESHAT
jgi:uncharacterized SAM-binding protein YcdF (DUF218 family)